MSFIAKPQLQLAYHICYYIGKLKMSSSWCWINLLLYQVGIIVKSNPGSNSDIDNRSDPDLVLLRMFSDCLRQRFNHHLGDQLLKTYSVLHTKNGLNHEQKTYLPMFLTKIQSQQTVFVVRINLWMHLHVYLQPQMLTSASYFLCIFSHFPMDFLHTVLSIMFWS